MVHVVGDLHLDRQNLIWILLDAVPHHLRFDATSCSLLQLVGQLVLEHHRPDVHHLLAFQCLYRLVRRYLFLVLLCPARTKSVAPRYRISYHLLDRVGLKLGKWIWDGLFVSKPNSASALPMKMLRSLGSAIVTAPGSAIRSFSTGSVNKYHFVRSTIHTLLNWRTPTTRPAVSDPSDPDVLAQLHSTDWTTDLSHDMEALKTRRLLRLQSFAWIPHLFLIPGLTAVWVYFHPTGQWTYDVMTFSTLWRFIWVLSIPNCLFAWFGFITPDSLPSKEVMDKKPVHREYIRNFFIVLVTKGSNEAAVRRGYNKLIKLEKYHPSVKVVVLTDEPYVYPDLQNIVCPKSYKSPLGASCLYAASG